MATNENSTTATAPVEPLSIKSSQPCNSRMVQNFRLVWLDGSIDENNDEECRNSINKLHQIVNNVNTFNHEDECINFINSIKKEKMFMISSGVLGQVIVPIVHDKPQVSTIYISGENKTHHEKWARQWPKIKGVFTDITSICEALKQVAQDCDENAVSVSLVKTTDGVENENLYALDQFFMYTQILKEIVLNSDFKHGHIDRFLTYCRKQFADNTIELNNVDFIEKQYRDHQPIWWYTYDCFLSSMLNHALRTMEVSLVIEMEFFIRDLHNNIATLHSEQYGGKNQSDSFIVYHGQSLSQTNFDQIMKTEDGLLSFNHFLSTSKIPDVSLDFVRQTIATSNLVGVLFVITIDPSIVSTPFANIRDVSANQTEEEILFSLYAVFRIEQIKQIDGNDRLWQVDLTLIGDNDSHLLSLTERMHEETKGSTGWLRLGKLMVKLAEYDKAKDLYDILLAQTIDWREKGDILYQLGLIKYYQAEYTESLIFYKNSLQIRQKLLTFQHPDVADCYNDIGLVYTNTAEYTKAISSHKKALEIRQKILSEDHADLATSYNNIGLVYDEMGEYPKALSYYEKDLEISLKSLPANHPDLATSYNNIGMVYDEMGEYEKALSYYEKDLEINLKALPAHHPSLATSYNNIGGVYDSMGEYSKALLSHEKALEIRQKTLRPNHPSLAYSYNNIGSVYDSMGEYTNALSYYEKALEMKQKTLSPDHPEIKDMKQHIESVKTKLNSK